MSDTNKRTEDSYEGQTAAPLLECHSNVLRQLTVDGAMSPVAPAACSVSTNRSATRLLIAEPPYR